MTVRVKYFYWFLLVVCAILAIAGVFQLGHLIGHLLYSTDYDFSSITITQVGFISLGTWAISEFVITCKKLSVASLYN